MMMAYSFWGPNYCHWKIITKSWHIVNLSYHPNGECPECYCHYECKRLRLVQYLWLNSILCMIGIWKMHQSCTNTNTTATIQMMIWIMIMMLIWIIILIIIGIWKWQREELQYMNWLEFPTVNHNVIFEEYIGWIF